jgi:hypothetical protein
MLAATEPPVVDEPRGCPRASALVLGCTASGAVRVRSLVELAAAFGAAALTPRVRGGQAEGLRLDGPGPLDLAVGEILLAVDGRRLVHAPQAVDALRAAHRRATLLVERAGRLRTIELVE